MQYIPWLTICVTLNQCWDLWHLVPIRIRTSDKWIRIRSWIRLLSSLILRMQKNFFSYLFFLTCPIIFGLKNYFFLLKFCVKILFCMHYFSPLNTFMRKGKDPEPDPDPYLWLMDPDSDPGDPTDPADPDPQHCFERFLCMDVLWVDQVPYSTLAR